MGKHTPILASYAHKVLELLGPGKVRFEQGNQWWANQINYLLQTENFKKIPILIEDRILYFKRFGITIAHQLDIEKSIEECKNIDDLHIPYLFMQRSFETSTQFK
jgi:hypothetical protein